ncbi:MAG TPA: hypothetical protein VLA66_06740 [Thermoanaerobaculia bacterium]|nr:hypothetical protein [Thermoanaerobaculia bacterium]
MKPNRGWLVATLLASLVAAGCGPTVERRTVEGAPPPSAGESGYGAGDGGGYSTEAERTQAMEAKAADIEARQQELMASGASEEELLEAAQALEAERQELNEMGEASPDETPY